MIGLAIVVIVTIAFYGIMSNKEAEKERKEHEDNKSKHSKTKK